MSQEELADRAGVSPRYIRQIERGRQGPGLRIIGALAAGLGIGADQLMRAAQDEMDLE